MNKKQILPIALVVLPLAAMMVAFMPNAVKYLYPSGEAVYMTYFGMVEEVKTAICMPAAVITIGITIFFAMAYSFSPKGYWLKAVSGPSFASSLLAVVPYLVQEEIMVRPNVLVPIVMLIEWLIAYNLGKDAENAPMEKEKGRRLGK